jgi:hypothetical protein
MADKQRTNEHGLPIHPEPGGEDRVLGHRPPPRGKKLFAPRLEPAEILPDSEWAEFEIDDPYPVYDQDGRGACDGFATKEAIEETRWVQGQPATVLSGWYVYAFLCGGVDQGASISEALDFAKSYGTCEDSLVPDRTINPRVITAAAQENAKRYRAEIGSMLLTWKEVMSEVQRRRFGNISVRVGAGFDNLDADGCPPDSNGPANHAVSSGYGAKRCKDGKWALKLKNHWRPTWGLKGYFWIKEKHLIGLRYFEAFSLAGAIEDPDDTSSPPAA